MSMIYTVGAIAAACIANSYAIIRLAQAHRILSNRVGRWQGAHLLHPSNHPAQNEVTVDRSPAQ